MSDKNTTEVRTATLEEICAAGANAGARRD